MEITLGAKPRNVLGKQNNKLRKSGFLPAVLYGKGKENLALQVSVRDFEKVFKQAGESTLINLDIEGKGSHKVLVHDVAMHFMKDDPIHIDFYEVDLTKKIHAKVPLHLVGVAPAVKELGGILIKSLSEVEVEALPEDLPQFVGVNLDSLKAIDNLIRLRELQVSDKVKILGQADEVVVSVKAPRTEEELAALEKPAAEEEKAVIEGMAKEAAAEKAAKIAPDAESATETKKTEAKVEEKKAKA
ncbi:MAG: 50S ribosomal protein L25 [bacterium]|nr:50S ribosomal protein L25 [bacterium]